MRIFRKTKNKEIEDPVRARFDTMLNLVKDLFSKDYKRLKKAMDAGYESYQIVQNLDNDGMTIEMAAYEITKEKEEK